MSNDVSSLVPANVPAVFSRLPAGWVYATATLEQQNALLAAVGELLAEEHFRGAEATAKIELLIVAARAAAVRAWLPDARTKLEKMIAAEKLLSEHDPQGLTEQREVAAAKVRRAGDELVRAQARYDEAVAEQHRIEHLITEREQAEKLMETSDVVLSAAWKRYADLRAAAKKEEKEHNT